MAYIFILINTIEYFFPYRSLQRSEGDFQAHKVHVIFISM